MDTINANNIHQLIQDASSVLLGDANASLVAENFSIALPAALSMQFDWHIKSIFYMNILTFQPVSFYKYKVQWPALLSIAPRYRSTLFEFALPVCLFNYSMPGIGASVRIGLLAIGTERIGALLGLDDIDGLDL